MDETRATAELRRSVTCLALEIPHAVHKDVAKKVDAVLAELVGCRDRVEQDAKAWDKALRDACARLVAAEARVEQLQRERDGLLDAVERLNAQKDTLRRENSDLALLVDVTRLAQRQPAPEAEARVEQLQQALERVRRIAQVGAGPETTEREALATIAGYIDLRLATLAGPSGSWSARTTGRPYRAQGGETP